MSQSARGEPPPGCGLAVASAACLLVLAGSAFWYGFFASEPRDFRFVFAALPISALFTVLGATLTTGSSDFLLAWPVDAGLWLAVAFIVSRWATSRGLGPRGYAVAFGGVVVLAAAYGIILSLLVEPA